MVKEIRFIFRLLKMWWEFLEMIFMVMKLGMKSSQEFLLSFILHGQNILEMSICAFLSTGVS